ncbi:MAG: transcription-repair coupling factor [Rhodospirillales bacterium]|nr:transcription-repair coupling factor [Rhodospirillales bacterium]
MTFPAEILSRRGRFAIAGAPAGDDALIIAELARRAGRCLCVVVADDVRLTQLAEALAFFAPDLDRLEFPAWDCLPYDRVSPNPSIAARRIETLARLGGGAAGLPGILLTTAAAALQRVLPADEITSRVITLGKGERRDLGDLVQRLSRLGFTRVETVADRGDFAVRGGIIDLFPPRTPDPLRLDFFGDEIDGIRAFDVASQRTLSHVDRCSLLPISEVVLDDATITQFRVAYRALAGAGGSTAVASDPLYAAVSAGQRYQGLEHWLPLFYPRLVPLFDYLAGAPVVLDYQADEAGEARQAMITEYYAARRELAAGRFAGTAAPYHPVPETSLFLDAAGWEEALAQRPTAVLSPFVAPDDPDGAIDAGGRIGADFSEARLRADLNVYDEVAARIALHRRQGRRVLIAAVSRGSRDRLATVLREHKIAGGKAVGSWAEAAALPTKAVALAVLALDRGFVTRELAVIAEQDILGDKMIRRGARRARAENFLMEASSLAPGDLVVHVDHGIGRYDALEAIAVDGAPHDCLRILYAEGARLYLPVENIEMIGRFGAESEGIGLDRLGGAAWQARKAKMAERLREMAGELIRIAAARAVREAPPMTAPEGLFDEFCARFPYSETDDQASAINETLADLGSGKPTDRLICGDVGFGKTEVALRAAFVTAIDGRQVAVVVPTTLLCRQHYRTFAERFRGFPINVAELSRLVSARDAKLVKAGLVDGTTDIVIGTHALVAKDIRFRDLGLLIIDEEQHFGVAHKERLKKLKSDVHVLTLSATPIPRTLQMALSGVREMSLIATPPVDRLAVRTFVLEFDPVVIREAILREKARGGQTFYVCPRIEDLDALRDTLAKLVPEVSVIMAHGRMAARELEAAVGAFYERRGDVLLSTNIIESGLDLPSVNTIVLHRADMFGLAGLYQLRGRVGRGKLRAYAYLTLPPRRKLTRTAEKRLSVMQALDALGAGFTIASHDLDIRGAGNLLGDEQTGHIKEVGIELYQQMLEDAVNEARAGGGVAVQAHDWSPQISLGLGVLIPEAYVPDLGVRLGLYRRVGDLADRAAIDAFAAELVDRFGSLPEEVSNLLEVVAIKQFCRTAHIERIEAGPKGAVIAFRNNAFPNPPTLVSYIARHGTAFKLRPDQRLVFRRDWETATDRLEGVRDLCRALAKLAATKAP